MWVMTLIVLTHFSCKKETGPVGMDVGDNDIGLQYIDTFTLITRTVREDSVISHNLSYNLLGAFNSSVYGKNIASLYCNFTLPQSNFSFGTTPQIDSVVLILKYLKDDQYSGDINDALTVNVSEITERLYHDSAYFSSRKFTTQNTPTLTTTLKVNLEDSIEVTEGTKKVTYAPHMRLTLGADMMNRFLSASPSDLASNESFQNYLKGLYVTIDNSTLGPEDGVVALMNLKEGLSGITVYYNDSLNAHFPISTSGVRVNEFKHDFSGSLASTQISNPQNYAETYLLSMAGLKTMIEVPGLTSLVEKGSVAIGNAFFEFHFDQGQISPDFDAFSRLLLVSRDSNGRNDFVADQLLEPNLYGGALNPTESKYSFNVTRHVQDILNQKVHNGKNLNRGFYLIVPVDNPVSSSRIAMDMTKGANRGIKFRVALIKTK